MRNEIISKDNVGSVVTKFETGARVPEEIQPTEGDSSYYGEMQKMRARRAYEQTLILVCFLAMGSILHNNILKKTTH
jgi:hypothetical protein